jgi:effector-binding domain-containing protein
MEYDVRLETSTGRPIAVVHRRAARARLGKVVQDACGLVWNVLRSQQIRGGRHVSIYWDGEINLDVGAELDAPFAGQGEVVGAALPNGLTATTTHFGPYGQLGAAHQAICDWCKANGHQLAGPNWEIYGHWQDAWNNDATLIQTDVFYLLASGS